MFTCISQLWDWLEPQPFETSTMDNRKRYNVPHDNRRYTQFTSGRPQEYYLPEAYHQQMQQQQQLYNLMYDSDYAKDYISSRQGRQLDENMLSPSEVTPTETQPYGNHHNLYYDRLIQEQIQQENERYHQMSPERVHQNTATSRLKHQYQQLQEEKMRMQIQTQNDAFVQQQQTFALRQQLNPPVPLSYPQSPTSITSQIAMAQHYQPKAPPTNLNLNNQYIYSPDGKSEKVDYQGSLNFQNPEDQERIAMKQNFFMQQQQQQQHQQHSKQQLQNLNFQSPQSHQVIIQQNHPSKVVNQAVQTQMSDASQKSSSSTSNTPQSPSHSILERRKSESLKSPIIKRMEGAPISLSGFLNKQGSDGLKVWKKRYFVLSEYCLFYYKGPEQDKLLGSVLLPSYTISPCTSDDKVYRKYAFKCEHANMRTYILAADTQESMEKWMKYLTMAAAMQDSTENSTSSINQSCSDSGIQTYQSQQSKYGPVTPSNEMQPLYINAPPKPSRKVGGDIGYSAHTSPDNRTDIYDAPRNSTINFVDSQAIYGIRNDTVTTNVLKKGVHANQNQQRYANSYNYQQQKTSLPLYNMQDQQIAERRTPDEYSPHEYSANNRGNYEDIYSGKAAKHHEEQTQSYKRPVSPQTRTIGLNPNESSQMSPTKVPMREKISSQMVPRPHSADFLDYENRVQLMPYEQGRAPRPKSSLDTNRAFDHYYYSEESYAEQMRTESANYLPKQNYRANSSYAQAPTTQQQQQHESRAQKITKRALRQQEFLRSASARIPRKADGQGNQDDSDKKREESMKRLLEWKQRMLQSPLTRKITSQTSTLPLESRHSALEELSKTNIHRAKSDIIKKDDSYNSYSSDDEDGARMARRSDKNHSLILHVEPSVQDSHSQSQDHNISIESFNSTNNSTISLSTPLYNQSYKPVYTQKTVVGSSANMYAMQTVKMSSNDLLEDKNRVLNENEIVVDENDQTNMIENLSELVDACDIDLDEPNTSFEYTDDDLNEVLLSSTPVIETNLSDEKEISANSDENINNCTENHYMPMTPKKPSENVTVPLDILSSIKKSGEVIDESAYIEMIKGSESLKESKSTYEFINFNNHTKKPKLNQQLEPLYMELSHNSKRNSLLKNILDLPDILKEPIITNSTSSLNRILAVEKNIKRFSLSDTFRPASYYLSTVKEIPSEHNNNKTIDENSDSQIHIESPWERRQKNLSFDIKSSVNTSALESKQLSTTQAVSQLSLPETLSKYYDITKENSLKLKYTSSEEYEVIHDRKNLELPSNHTLPLDSVPFDYSKKANDLLFFDLTCIKPPDGFKNNSNEALDTNHETLCNKNSSESHLDCYYDSLEDINNSIKKSDDNINKEENANDLPNDQSISLLANQDCLGACRLEQSRSEEIKNIMSETAPYYYSDIAQSSKMDVVETTKLNNLKDVNIHRAGIPHIHNIIYNNIQENDFKEANDKMNGINMKNLYENDHNKLQKNIDKDTERILFSKTTSKPKTQNTVVANVSGEQLWEEDSLWCERLRVQSHRHTKSLDELNRMEEEHQAKKSNDKTRQNSKLTREVTYVNSQILPIKQKHMDRKSLQILNQESEVYGDEADDVYVQLAVTEDLYETLREEETQKKLYSIDREKIRQWDLMSSGLHLTSSFGNLQKPDYNENKNES